MQGRCEQLEKEVEWVRSERDEAQKASEASAARVKELETAACRQKGHRKDDSKKAAKEGKAAVHRAEVRQSGLSSSAPEEHHCLGDGSWHTAGMLQQTAELRCFSGRQSDGRAQVVWCGAACPLDVERHSCCQQTGTRPRRLKWNIPVAQDAKPRNKT